ncbi:meiosis-specific topoisomerase Spo11 [Paraphoma chrysanthemicola]|uniref:DNA topoisomerase (ATP-hydrolyzing) n=1 Tax=Paraphoma chrysanthemicola TaxID=798071 RepID=A0A8K0R1X8_9PLEO|nr:meiosis-specific topoisomerase Spo11 [Paraphoma chrysanthemicola]
MEPDDFEDMLFGNIAPTDFQEYAERDTSDDDLLDNGDEDDATLWDSQEDLWPTLEGVADLLHAHDDDDSLEDYLQSHSTLTVSGARDRPWVIARLEDMLERIVDGLLDESESLTISLKSRSGISRKRANAVDDSGHPPQPKQRDFNFPGATAQEAWNFTVLLRIIELVYTGLLDNTVMTKRDLYYRHPDLFVKQSVVDRYVDDLACTLGVSRSQLNVGILVPKVGQDDTMDLTSVQWVLVIEKEATFRSLLSSAHWDTLGPHGMVLTAKGYPDVASRAFLRIIADQAPHLPIHCLVDSDPDGIAILSTYKYGSYRLAHEDVALSATPGLSLPTIRWLGVKSHHIIRTPVGECDTSPTTRLGLQGLMRLTARDRNKVSRMLEWDLCAEDGPEQGWRSELQTMLMLNIKAEMQILDEMPGGLVSWLSMELFKTYEEGPEHSTYTSSVDDGMLF